MARAEQFIGVKAGDALVRDEKGCCRICDKVRGRSPKLTTAHARSMKHRLQVNYYERMARYDELQAKGWARVPMHNGARLLAREAPSLVEVIVCLFVPSRKQAAQYRKVVREDGRHQEFQEQEEAWAPRWAQELLANSLDQAPAIRELDVEERVALVIQAAREMGLLPEVA